MFKDVAGDVTGLGYTYPDFAAAMFIDEHIREQIVDENPIHISALWNKLFHTVRNSGNPGVSAMAISAVDIALWDLKSKVFGLPINHLLPDSFWNGLLSQSIKNSCFYT